MSLSQPRAPPPTCGGCLRPGAWDGEQYCENCWRRIPLCLECSLDRGLWRPAAAWDDKRFHPLRDVCAACRAASPFRRVTPADEPGLFYIPGATC